MLFAFGANSNPAAVKNDAILTSHFSISHRLAVSINKTSPIANRGNWDKKRSSAQGLVLVSTIPGPNFGSWEAPIQNNQRRYSFMKFYNVRLLGSLTALALIGVSAAQAQSFPAMMNHPGSSSSVPANVAGGFAKFTPDIKISSIEKAAGTVTINKATFPLPAIPGHRVVVQAISPGIFPDGILFLPIDPQSQPAKAGDFALLGGVSLAYPQDGIFISFTDFREDTSGSALLLCRSSPWFRVPTSREQERTKAAITTPELPNS
jgi:hypothetical protein